MDVAVIADELTAVGWELAGARTFVATSENLESSFHTARREADLVLLTAELAARLPAAALQAALREDGSAWWRLRAALGRWRRRP